MSGNDVRAHTRIGREISASQYWEEKTAGYFTGIDSAYEPPPAPEVHLRTDAMSAADCVAAILDGLDGREAAP